MLHEYQRERTPDIAHYVQTLDAFYGRNSKNLMMDIPNHAKLTFAKKSSALERMMAIFDKEQLRGTLDYKKAASFLKYGPTSTAVLATIPEADLLLRAKNRFNVKKKIAGLEEKVDLMTRVMSKLKNHRPGKEFWEAYLPMKQKIEAYKLALREA